MFNQEWLKFDPKVHHDILDRIMSNYFGFDKVIPVPLLAGKEPKTQAKPLASRLALRISLLHKYIRIQDSLGNATQAYTFLRAWPGIYAWPGSEEDLSVTCVTLCAMGLHIQVKMMVDIHRVDPLVWVPESSLPKV
jgi:hypothetical protein